VIDLMEQLRQHGARSIRMPVLMHSGETFFVRVNRRDLLDFLNEWPPNDESPWPTAEVQGGVLYLNHA